jgi:hypothetical protein
MGEFKNDVFIIVETVFGKEYKIAISSRYNKEVSSYIMLANRFYLNDNTQHKNKFKSYNEAADMVKTLYADRVKEELDATL